MPQLDKNILNYLPNMAVQLLDHHQTQVYNTIAALYENFNYFDSVVSDKLKTFIRECWNIVIDHDSAKKAVELAFPWISGVDKRARLVHKACRLILYATLIEIMMTRAEGRELLAVSDAELISTFPSLSGQPEDTLNFLFNFWNYLKVALLVMPSKNNKLDLLNILGHLAGSPKPLVSGSGQCLLVDQCVMLYEKEGKLEAKKRAKRAAPKNKKEPKKRDRTKKPPGAPRANKQLDANDVLLTPEELAKVRGEDVTPATKRRRTSVSSRSVDRASHASENQSQRLSQCQSQSTRSGSCSSYNDSGEDSDFSSNSECSDNDNVTMTTRNAVAATASGSADTVHADLNWNALGMMVSRSSDTVDATVAPEYVPSHPSSYYAYSTSSSAMLQSFYYMQASTSISSNLDGHVFATTNAAAVVDVMPAAPSVPSVGHATTAAGASDPGAETADEPFVW
jgi:hypothetical protein